MEADFHHDVMKANLPRPTAGLQPGTELEQTGEAKTGRRRERETLKKAKAKARDEVLHIHRWDGEVDAQAVNEALLAVMRAVDAKSALTEAERARRCQMTRQKYHQLSTDVKVVSIPALVQWANGHHLNADFLFGEVLDWVRRKTLPF
jgi:hypothetical protein